MSARRFRVEVSRPDGLSFKLTDRGGMTAEQRERMVSLCDAVTALVRSYLRDGVFDDVQDGRERAE